ncbi:MAG: ABC transporter substrate-binding protein [SAR324 cluster bacterium]|nr:ABC transporter substrate-binding protein [SAR324 cluster bacterium]MCH8885969.1 ABC transporter substrate-binding protein [SAR324 cluster bacterium]
MTNIRTNLVVLAAAVVFATAGATGAVAQTIRVGAASNIGGMIVFIAQGKGFFAKHGLNAKVVVRNTGPALTKSLMAGEIDFAPAAFTNLPVALEKGIKLRGIVGYLGSHFNSSVSDNNVGILVRPGSGIKTINDLRGKKVGVAFGTTGDLYFLGVLKRAGMSKNDVTRINVRPPSHVSTLDSGGVDAMVAWEPNITRALDKIKGSTLLLRGGGYVCFCAGMHGKPEFVYEDRKRTQAFVDAMAEAAHFLRDPNNIKEVAEIGARFVRGMSPALVERTLKFVVFDARIGGGTKAAFNSSVKLLIAAKKMKRPFDAAKYLDTSFIDSTIRRHPEWFSDLK